MAETLKTQEKMAELTKHRKNYQTHPDYENLPASVKAIVTPAEHAWLGRENRNNLIQELTMPDPED